MPISREDVLRWLEACARVLAENKDYLTQLDSAIGDADHGANMDRGFKAMMTKLPTVADKDIGTIFKTAGMTLVSTVGGASGPLYGTFFMQAGTASANKLVLAPEEWAATLESAVNGVVARGKASLGDKTMVDALLPSVDALKQALAAGVPLAEALRRCAATAEQGMLDTVPLVARKGRASYLGERSAGHQDPGATSSYLLLKTAADTWSGG